MDLDWVKTNLDQAYLKPTAAEMKLYIEEIINYSKGTENKHFIWFARLLQNHIDGIISHAEYPLSNGKFEGINQKIKTIRRKSYGLPDDEYFFLKLFDA
ncbi:MAG: transposase [Succinivibrio sp.]